MTRGPGVPHMQMALDRTESHAAVAQDRAGAAWRQQPRHVVATSDSPLPGI